MRSLCKANKAIECRLLTFFCCLDGWRQAIWGNLLVFLGSQRRIPDLFKHLVELFAKIVKGQKPITISHYHRRLTGFLIRHWFTASTIYVVFVVHSEMRMMMSVRILHVCFFFQDKLVIFKRSTVFSMLRAYLLLIQFKAIVKIFFIELYFSLRILGLKKMYKKTS